MKTKRLLLSIAVMTMILCITGSAFPGEIQKNFQGMILTKHSSDFLKKAPGHFEMLSGQTGMDQPLLKSANVATLHADSLFRYSIGMGNEKDVYAYDNSGNQLSQLTQNWVIDNWRNSELITNTYDGNGNVLVWTNQYWHNNAWLNYSKITYTYDGAGNYTTKTGVLWRNLLTMARVIC